MSNAIDPVLKELFVSHISLNFKNYGPLSAMINGTFEYVGFAKYPMQSKDRLYNPEIDFPIGIVFGDSDFFGSEGSDEIVQNSKYFKTGES